MVIAVGLVMGATVDGAPVGGGASTGAAVMGGATAGNPPEGSDETVVGSLGNCADGAATCWDETTWPFRYAVMTPVA